MAITGQVDRLCRIGEEQGRVCIPYPTVPRVQGSSSLSRVRGCSLYLEHNAVEGQRGGARGLADESERQGQRGTPSSRVPETGRKAQVSELISWLSRLYGYDTATIPSLSSPEGDQSRRSQRHQLHRTSGVATRWSGGIRFPDFDHPVVSQRLAPLYVTSPPKLGTKAPTAGETP